MMRHRLIMAVIFVPLIVLLVQLPNRIPLLCFLILVAAFGQFEFYRVMTLGRGVKPLVPLGILGGLLILLLAYRDAGELRAAVSLVIMIAFLWHMTRRDLRGGVLNCAITVLGVLYVAWLLSYVISLRVMEDGAGFVLALWTITWMADAAAFGVGKGFGRRKIAPRISPEKTAEGAGAAVLVAIGMAFLLKAVFKSRMPYPVGHAAWLGLVLGVGAVLGDLCESLLKRAAGRKDSGTAMPGYGGVLDIFDSLLFNAPLMYYYAKWW